MKPIVLAASLALFASLSQAQEWSRFRGPNGSGVSSARGVPTSFGPEENALWKAEVPFGSSSPILTEDAVVVTGADAENLYVMALDRESGEELWSQALSRVREQEVFAASDSASPSPTTDGKNVYAFFPELGLISFDDQGDERWMLPLGPFVSFYGMSGSPILAGDLLILQCDQQQDSFMIGVDTDTGEERWRLERKGIIECWTTPVVHPAESPEQVILFGTYFVTGHSLETGAELWRMKGFGYTPVCSPILAGDHLYVSVANHGEEQLPSFEALCADADGNEDGRLARTELGGPMGEHFGWADANKDDFIDEDEWNFVYEGMKSKDYGLAAIDLKGEDGPVELWRYKKGLPSISSPLLYEGILYLARDSGLMTLIDAESGGLLARERLPDGMGECWPSPIAADGKVYVTNNAGQVAVLAAGPDWKVLGTNDLGEECMATPAVGDSSLFVRTKNAVYRFGEPGP